MSIRPLGTNFGEILIKIQNFSFTKMHLKISSAKGRPFSPKGYMSLGQWRNICENDLSCFKYWLRQDRDICIETASVEKLHIDAMVSNTYFISLHFNYSDVIMRAMESQITSVSIICSTVCPGADQRKHQSSASLAFVGGIHRWPVDSPHKGPSNAENASIWWRHHAFCFVLFRLGVGSCDIWRGCGAAVWRAR